MRRRRKNKKREKIIMLCSSAFVLTLLTVTGVYVSEKNKIEEDYVVDLSKLEVTPVEEMAENYYPVEEEEITAPVTSAKVENPRSGEASFEEETGKNDKAFEDTMASSKKEDVKQEEALEQVLTEHRITQTDFDKLPASLQNAYTQQADALVESSRVTPQASIWSVERTVLWLRLMSAMVFA